MSRLTGAWADARRILVVRLDALGDVVMTSPAFRALAQAGEDVRLTLLTSRAGAAVAPLLPEIGDVVVHDVPWMKAEPVGGPPAGSATDRALIERLRAGDFDAAVIFTVHTQSALPAALLCHLADIPLRLAHARENPYRLLTDWVPDPESDEPTRHEVRRQLDLVATVGATIVDDHLSVRVPADAARGVRAALRRLGIGDERPWAVLAPGASASSRRYPAASYRAVAERLAGDHGWHVLVVGTADEAEVIEAVVAGGDPRLVPLAGRLDLGEVTALLAMAPVLIANNSGPAHLAAAVGTPVVDLYALTNLQHAPWGVPTRVLARDVPCKGCRKSVCPMGDQACIAAVEPEAVVDAALELVARRLPRAALSAGILAPDPRGGSTRPPPGRPGTLRPSDGRGGSTSGVVRWW